MNGGSNKAIDKFITMDIQHSIAFAVIGKIFQLI